MLLETKRNRQRKNHNLSKTLTYRTWKAMKVRCQNKKSKDYKNYGGRGIKVCKRWQIFKNFYNDMGDRQKGFTIDRKDPNKNYCKSNCRWASIKEQSDNKTNTRKIKIKGKIRTRTAWLKFYSIKRGTYKARIKRGWSEVDALTRGVR